MKKAIKVSEQMMPRRDPQKKCSCQDSPVDLRFKAGTICWLFEEGTLVEKNEPVCVGEIEKKVLEFLAPEKGILTEICIREGQKFTAGDVLGWIDVGINS
ncbi:MAG: hypothetical protein PWR12_1119 [Eubacteriaceae bacterium]|jgi:biotin carboxyl carrier protein|nr:hypothetical protein [Eubacteriaceae bacterium]MDK2937194.1 hypothetical protein [Eubacteriaceae bacterium]MDK2962485.1 hypothetical protein [Eubacteriaceae bacterium]